MYDEKNYCFILVDYCHILAFETLKVKISNEKTFVDGNVLCKRIHSNLYILKNNQLNP
jgi:hypothetical protein